MAAAAAAGETRRRSRQLLDLLLRQWPSQVGHRPAGREDLRCRVLGGDEHELPLLQRTDGPVERGDVGAAGGGTQALQHACLVVLGLQPPDEPGAGVRHRLVVEVDRVLGREHEAEAERATLLEDGQDRLLRRRCGGRRHVAGDLVHVRERAQVRRSRLAAHPRHELAEDERRHEHALLVREVRQVDDRGAGLTLRREQERLRVERRALVPGREGGRRDQRIQLQRELPCGRRAGRTRRSRTRRACGAEETAPRR